MLVEKECFQLEELLGERGIQVGKVGQKQGKGLKRGIKMSIKV